MTLSDGQLAALRNLSQKKAGAVVGWIGIAEARDLTELGFAARTAAGWRITPAGEEMLTREAPVTEAPNVVAMQRPDEPR